MAKAAKQQPNPNAMALATVGGEEGSGGGRPAVRIVLCRGMSVEEGYLIFYTNYRGRKGRELSVNGFAAATFHWDHPDHQVRFEGRVVKSPEAESDAYFHSRPWQSRISAWVSEQSEPLASRGAMMAQVGEVMQRLNLDAEDLMARGNEVHIPRPPHWGGFRLWASRVEMWIGGPGRFHDRAEWVRGLGEFDASGRPEGVGAWRSTRLQP
jgi:pyridoxamine 5'-phosphate oxidase